MKPAYTEACFTQDVLRLASIYGWHALHIRAARTIHGWRTPVSADGKGYPDLTLIRERVIFAELKMGRGRLRPEQLAWQIWLRNAGQEVYVWRYPNDLDQIEIILRR